MSAPHKLKTLEQLQADIRQCTLCSEHLELGPNPVVHVGAGARIMIIGQAPGTRVHQTGIPWNDPSGNRLREWLDIDKDSFYDTDKIAIMPMGFCYPGKGKSGDLPPRPECADKWHQALLEQLPNIELTLLIGQYAQNHYLSERGSNLTETVKRFEQYLPDYLPLPHPSPRNNLWLRRNPWFEADVIPRLRKTTHRLLKMS